MTSISTAKPSLAHQVFSLLSRPQAAHVAVLPAEGLHPLDPLTAGEITAAGSACKAHAEKLGVADIRFNAITLQVQHACVMHRWGCCDDPNMHGRLMTLPPSLLPDCCLGGGRLCAGASEGCPAGVRRQREAVCEAGSPCFLHLPAAQPARVLRRRSGGRLVLFKPQRPAVEQSTPPPCALPLTSEHATKEEHDHSCLVSEHMPTWSQHP